MTVDILVIGTMDNEGGWDYVLSFNGSNPTSDQCVVLSRAQAAEIHALIEEWRKG